MFAALNSVETWVWHYFLLKIEEASEASKIKAKTLVDQRVKALSDVLSDREFFGEKFSIADIIMTTVLRTAQRSHFLDNYENLMNYVQRNESRPAFKRALNEHVKLYITRSLNCGLITMPAKHYICSSCGTYTHQYRRLNPIQFDFNIACLENSTLTVV